MSAVAFVIAGQPGHAAAQSRQHQQSDDPFPRRSATTRRLQRFRRLRLTIVTTITHQVGDVVDRGRKLPIQRVHQRLGVDLQKAGIVAHEAAHKGCARQDCKIVAFNRLQLPHRQFQAIRDLPKPMPAASRAAFSRAPTRASAGCPCCSNCCSILSFHSTAVVFLWNPDSGS